VANNLRSGRSPRARAKGANNAFSSHLPYFDHHFYRRLPRYLPSPPSHPLPSRLCRTFRTRCSLSVQSGPTARGVTGGRYSCRGRKNTHETCYGRLLRAQKRHLAFRMNSTPFPLSLSFSSPRVHGPTAGINRSIGLIRKNRSLISRGTHRELHGCM
jgi:hypothetical protein